MSARIDFHTEDLRLLVACVADGSLSAAARKLGLTQAVASRRIQRLEAAVGAPVLHRTTRALRPTADGERLLGTARGMMAELDAFERTTKATLERPSGEVRVSAPVLLGQAIGSTLAIELARKYPDLRLDLSLSNAKADLVRERVDVALRVGSLPSATLLAARLATAQVAAYARRDGPTKAKHPSELLVVEWIGVPGDAVLRATGPNGERWRGQVTLSLICDDRIVLRDAAAAGMGATLLPTFLGDATPNLRRIARDWHFGNVPVHAVWLPEARHDPRVRAVLDVVTTWGRTQRW